MWLRILGGLLVVSVVASGLALRHGQRRWCAATETLTLQLRPSALQAPAVFSEADLADLPAPVARYLRTALRDGQPPVERAHIAWEGQFNTGRPGQDAWKPFSATQVFVPAAPGFVWDARVRMAPGVQVWVRDGFVAGHGSMRAAILGLATVVDVGGGSTIDAAALQRYLAEAVWFPTALLPSQGVTWTAIDPARAAASIEGGGTRVGLEFRFDADGLVREMFTPERFYDDGRNTPVARPWTAHILRYRNHDAMQVPAEAVVEWSLPEGNFQYWRGRPRAIDLAYARPYRNLSG
jgi:hypothetical protein